MAKPVKKIEDSGNHKIILTERGYTFGYNDLIVDPRSFFLLNQIGYPVVFDAGHSIRKYGIPSKDPRGGARQFLDTLARSAVAAGVDGFFIEAHPNPPEALCDAASQYYLDDLEKFMRPLIDIHNLVRSQRRCTEAWNSISTRSTSKKSKRRSTSASSRGSRRRPRSCIATASPTSTAPSSSCRAWCRSCRSKRSATRRTRSSPRRTGCSACRSSASRCSRCPSRTKA